MTPWDLIAWGWAGGLALFGIGMPCVILLLWAHAGVTRARVIATKALRPAARSES